MIKKKKREVIKILLLLYVRKNRWIGIFSATKKKIQIENTYV